MLFRSSSTSPIIVAFTSSLLLNENLLFLLVLLFSFHRSAITDTCHSFQVRYLLSAQHQLFKQTRLHCSRPHSFSDQRQTTTHTNTPDLHPTLVQQQHDNPAPTALYFLFSCKLQRTIIYTEYNNTLIPFSTFLTHTRTRSSGSLDRHTAALRTSALFDQRHPPQHEPESNPLNPLFTWQAASTTRPPPASRRAQTPCPNMGTTIRKRRPRRPRLPPPRPQPATLPRGVRRGRAP